MHSSFWKHMQLCLLMPITKTVLMKPLPLGNIRTNSTPQLSSARRRRRPGASSPSLLGTRSGACTSAEAAGGERQPHCTPAMRALLIPGAAVQGKHELTEEKPSSVISHHNAQPAGEMKPRRSEYSGLASGSHNPVHGFHHHGIRKSGCAEDPWEPKEKADP